MTQIQWQQLEATFAGMTEAEKQRLAGLLTPAAANALPSSSNPSLGLFADEPELIDEIMEGVYLARETHPLRTRD
jgi:hypothetical protein